MHHDQKLHACISFNQVRQPRSLSQALQVLSTVTRNATNMCPADPVHLCKVVTCQEEQNSNAQGSMASQGLKARQKHCYRALCPSCWALSHRSQHPWSHPWCLQHCKAMMMATHSQRVHKMPTVSLNTSNASFDISYTTFAKFAIPDCIDHSKETLISLHCILHLIQIMNAPLHHFLSCFISFC